MKDNLGINVEFDCHESDKLNCVDDLKPSRIDDTPEERTKAFSQRLEEIKKLYRCDLATHQNCINGQLTGPVQVIIVAGN